ncbi:MAG: formylglycine-generating enzyme family protein [Deltaproteobacteria bacterium]|nr:formylglycine-generating enzyme family protein [Deltaproteobacteria bacterium]
MTGTISALMRTSSGPVVPARVRLLLLAACVALVSACGACSREPTGTLATSSGGGAGPIAADCHDGWCRIPPGTFVMGSPEAEWGRGLKSEDQVEVTFTRGFLIQQHEMTQREWTAHDLPNPSGLMENGTGDCLDPDCPVGNVTWFEAVAFANVLSQAEGLPTCYELEGCSAKLGEGMTCETAKLTASTLYECKGYRLPTEAEWEYAVRAGTTTAFYSGDITVYPNKSDCNPDPNLEASGWYCYTAGTRTHPVGQRKPNGWGLYDMSGNAFEWVHDHYTPSGYGEGPLTDPDGEVVLDNDRVFRGGGFNVWATTCRSADRLSGSWNDRGPGLGFRLVRTLPDG